MTFKTKTIFCLFRVPRRSFDSRLNHLLPALSESFEKSPGFPGIIPGISGAFLFSETRIIPGENGHEFV